MHALTQENEHHIVRTVENSCFLHTQVKQVATLAELEAILATSGDAIVCIDFTATWCGPCQQIAPAFELMSTELPGIVFLKVDVDENEVCLSSICRK